MIFKSKKSFLTVLVIMTLSIFCFFGMSRVYSHASLVTSNAENKVDASNNMISIMLETSAGSGDYTVSSLSSFPTTGYTYNENLSYCENGSTLTWNKTNKNLAINTSKTDKCYVYFDVAPPKFSDYFINGSNLASSITNYADAAGSSNSKIYHHDSSLTNGAGDNSYRYSGADPNNYVCFGTNATPCPTDNLYRIIGIFGDKVKLIKYDYATSALLGTDGDYIGSGTPDAENYKGSLTTISTYYWNYKADTTINSGHGSNTWSTSLLNKTNLNTNFITNIGTEWANKIATTTWKVGGNTYANIYNVVPARTYQNEIVNPVATNTTDNATEYPAKIGLMYASDYGFAADPSAWTTTLSKYNGSVNGSTIKSLNWMYMGGRNELTISRNSGVADFVFYVGDTGYVSNNYASSKRVVRPSFNLESSVTYVSGSGSADDPIRIN